MDAAAGPVEGGNMSEYIKIKRRLYDELIEIKSKYIVLCKMLESMKKVYEQNKPMEGQDD